MHHNYYPNDIFLSQTFSRRLTIAESRQKIKKRIYCNKNNAPDTDLHPHNQRPIKLSEADFTPLAAVLISCKCAQTLSPKQVF